MQRVFTEVNNGVYRCGFAGSQDAYDAAYDRLFTALDWLEERLADRRYLMGPAITEADVRLFTTLARFDAVYHGHFKCNRNKLAEMPHLWPTPATCSRPRLRRHDRLRADQAALLPRAHQPEPVRDRARRSGPHGLADPAPARRSLMHLDGARVLVAGATGVIGRGPGERPGRGGSPGRGGRPRRRAARCPGQGGRTAPLSFDVVDDASCRSCVATAVEELGGLDALVVTVGVAGFGPAVDADPAVVEELFAVNALGPMNLVRAAAAHLAEGGTVVVVSAILADAPTVGMADYSAAKSALAAWLGVVRREQRKAFGVIDVRPPHLDTGLDTRALAGDAPKLPEPLSGGRGGLDDRHGDARRCPRGRVGSEGEEPHGPVSTTRLPSGSATISARPSEMSCTPVVLHPASVSRAAAASRSSPESTIEERPARSGLRPDLHAVPLAEVPLQQPRHRGGVGFAARTGRRTTPARCRGR